MLLSCYIRYTRNFIKNQETLKKNQLINFILQLLILHLPMHHYKVIQMKVKIWYTALILILILKSIEKITMSNRFNQINEF